MSEKYIKNYINGALVPALSGKYLDNINPSTAKVYSYFPDSGEADLEQAVEIAAQNFSAWTRLDPERRFRILMRLADILEQNQVEFARAEALDTGKPISMAVNYDVPDAQACFRYYATSILHQQNTTKSTQTAYIQLALRQPIGVVACLASWSMPLFTLCQKIAPALAAGNCVIAKPSQYAPMTAFMLAQACAEAGMPSGVLNIIHGQDAPLHEWITQHPKIQAIAYTGDSKAGTQIIRHALPRLKKLSLNQGGNNANIILEDCDFDKMMVGTLRSSFSNNGQLRHHASRIFIQRSKYEKFKIELVKRTQFL
ncbi:MAG: aldehyde dehydrogenase family protein, partial [Bacteroidota bacterium]